MTSKAEANESSVAAELALAHLDLEPKTVVDSGISISAANWIDTNGDASPCESLVPISVTQRLPRKEKGGSLG